MTSVNPISTLLLVGLATLVGCNTAPTSNEGHHDHGHADGHGHDHVHAPVENPTTTIDDERSAKTASFLKSYAAGDFGPAKAFFAEDVRFHPNSKAAADSFGLDEWYDFVKMHHEGFRDIIVEPMFVQTSEYSNGEVWTHVWANWRGINSTTDEPFDAMIHPAYQWDGDRVTRVFQYFDAGKFEAEMETALGDRFAADAPSPWEWVTGYWRASGGDMPEAMVNWTTPLPGVDMVMGEWINADGIRSIQMVGWNPHTGHLTSAEYGSDGASFAFECQEFPHSRAMHGTYRMRAADGTEGTGVVEIVRERDDLMIATMINEAGEEVVRTYEPAEGDDPMRMSLAVTATNTDRMSETVRNIHRNYEAGNLDALEPHFADDCVYKWGDPTTPADKATWRAGLGVHHDTFKDIRLDDLYVQTGEYPDGRVWTTSWLEWNGVNRATDEPAVFVVHTAHRWENDQIVEEVVFFDIGRFQDHVEAVAAANGN